VTQDELKEAVLAALLDYETFKKTRRTKALKKAFRGTVMATVIGGAGFTGANDGRGNQASAAAPVLASDQNVPATDVKPPQDIWKDKVIWGAVYFGVDQHKLTSSGQEQLKRLAKQLPRFAELTIIGCTDSKGDPLHNEKLGKQRAQTVANFLTLQGIKVKTINSMISSNEHVGWIARRVDIIVNSSSASLAKHPAIPQKQAQDQKIASPAFTNPEYKSKPVSETEHGKTGLGQEIGLEKGKIEPLTIEKVTIRGVTYFAFDQHKLIPIHQERLLELVKQLPADAVLTVIGRTDSYGDATYNKNLGMLRAKTVATFLANHGIKVKAVGTKLSKGNAYGWHARRVDIDVDTRETALDINLPEPVHKHAHQPGSRSKANSHAHPIPSTASKTPSAGEKDIIQWKQHAQKLLETELK